MAARRANDEQRAQIGGAAATSLCVMLATSTTVLRPTRRKPAIRRWHSKKECASSGPITWCGLADYIIAAVGDQPDAQAAAARLMKNQDDIGQAVAMVYGAPAGQQLTSLLKDHITVAVELIKAAKAGDKAAQQQADGQVAPNATQIADFLSKANPNWPRATLVEMMNKHLSTTTDEVVARLNKNWDGDVQAFDAVYADILHDGRRTVRRNHQAVSGKIRRNGRDDWRPLTSHHGRPEVAPVCRKHSLISPA